MKRILFAVALVSATLFGTTDAEAGVFGRRCTVRCERVVNCQPRMTVVKRCDVCTDTCRVAPVRTVLQNAGQVLHRVLPPYGCNTCTATCVTSTAAAVEVKSLPSPTQAEAVPPAPNVLPPAPKEDP